MPATTPLRHGRGDPPLGFAPSLRAPRPEYPELYPETDERHWYDLEYAGWGVAKVNQPESPRDGPAGKRVACGATSMGLRFLRMSAAYLGKVFREATGSSFSSYLNELRVRQAERILATRKVKAKDVAIAVGYADANYFYSVFKKATGRYPSELQGLSREEGPDPPPGTP